MSIFKKSYGMLHLKPLLFAVAVICFTIAIPNPEKTARQRFPVETLDSRGASLTPAQVIAYPDSAWRETDPRLSLYSGEAWYRFTIPPAPLGSVSGRMAADVRFSLLNKAEFYLVDQGEVVDEWLAGMGNPGRNRGHVGPGYTFLFTPSSTHLRYLFMRIVNFPVNLGMPSIRVSLDFEGFNAIHLTILGLLWGVALGILLFNAVTSVIMRENMFGSFLGMQVAILGLIALFGGLFACAAPSWIVHPDLISLAISMLLLGIVPLLATFLRRYLFLALNFPLLDRTMLWIGRAAIAALLLLPLLPPEARLIVAVAGLVLMCVFVTVRLLFYTKLPKLSRLRFYSFWLELAAILTILAHLGVIDAAISSMIAFCASFVWMSLFLTDETAITTKTLETNYRRIVAGLQSTGHKKGVNALLGDTFASQYTASEMSVSIVFIDIVSFAYLATRLPAEKMFEQLTHHLSQITNTIKEFGGSIDRSLGDGVLCFFGYNKKGSPAQHTLDAFQAAVKIQQDIVAIGRKLAEASDDGQLLFPVRIGLHTDKVVIGNLGSDLQVDFSVVGQGVILANRLETACSPFRIMISEKARRLLVATGMPVNDLQAIQIGLKHQTDLMQAWEYDPFAKVTPEFKLAEQYYFRQIGLCRVEAQRLQPGAQNLVLKSQYGDYHIVDYSLNGFKAGGKTLLGPKAILEVRLETHDPILNQKLEHALLRDITVEVRWSRRVHDEFHHGLKILGGNQEQRETLCNLLGAGFAASCVGL